MVKKTCFYSNNIRISSIFVGMKSYLKTVSKQSVIITGPGGEVLGQENHLVEVMTKDKEQFFLVYSSLIGLLGSMSNCSVKVLSYLLLNYKSGSSFEIGGATRRMIGEKMGLSLSGVANALTELKNNKIVYSESKSIYMLNPRFAFQGTRAERGEALTAIIKLGCKGC